jgi:tellurite resistance protein TerC
MWAGFIALVVVLVGFDLWVSGRRHAPLTVRQAAYWTVFWIALAVVFGLGVWWFEGTELAAQYFTAYLLEKTLSVDNLFVFLIIFARFRVPAELRHKVLTWGILGALVLRAVMILAGIQLIRMWHPVIYVFGAFLIFTGVKTWFDESHEDKEVGGRWERAFERLMPFVMRYEGEKFFVRENGKRVGTLLLLVLLIIEGTDVAFAVDSIPAVLAVSDDPFIVFSSNILAILGLRALFFTVADLLQRLRYLRHGLAIILVVIGIKMCASDFVKIPAVVSFAITAGILAITVALSLWRKPAPAAAAKQPVDV